MTLPATLRTAALAGLLALSAGHPVAACAFHTALPETSLAEEIARAVSLIAARPGTADPFRFASVAVLRGGATPDLPPHLVDSATRRRLSQDPDAAVLFARAADGTWTRLLLVDAGTRPVVDRIVARAALWTTPGGAAERRDTFAGLLAHPDTDLRRIALRELDALPYAVLRQGRYPVAAADLLGGLSVIEEMPYAPIRILLLGIDGGPAARDEIARRMARTTSAGADANLGAWITAAIESGGADGIADVERLLTGASELSGPQLVEIVRALSVQSAEGRADLRAPLDVAIRRLAARHPSAAPLVAQAFGARADYSQTSLIRELVSARAFTSRADLMAATAYIARARAPVAAGTRGLRPGQARPAGESPRLP
jgi:hypothetical protein